MSESQQKQESLAYGKNDRLSCEDWKALVGLRQRVPNLSVVLTADDHLVSGVGKDVGHAGFVRHDLSAIRSDERLEDGRRRRRMRSHPDLLVLEDTFASTGAAKSVGETHLPLDFALSIFELIAARACHEFCQQRPCRFTSARLCSLWMLPLRTQALTHASVTTSGPRGMACRNLGVR